MNPLPRPRREIRQDVSLFRLFDVSRNSRDSARWKLKVWARPVAGMAELKRGNVYGRKACRRGRRTGGYGENPPDVAKRVFVRTIIRVFFFFFTLSSPVITTTWKILTPADEIKRRRARPPMLSAAGNEWGGGGAGRRSERLRERIRFSEQCIFHTFNVERAHVGCKEALASAKVRLD